MKFEKQLEASLVNTLKEMLNEINEGYCIEGKGDHEVVYTDRNYNTVRKVFKNDPQGPPGNAETAARNHAAKIDSQHRLSQYGVVRGPIKVRSIESFSEEEWDDDSKKSEQEKMNDDQDAIDDVKIKAYKLKHPTPKQLKARDARDEFKMDQYRERKYNKNVDEADDSFLNPMKKTLNRNLLKYAAGHHIFCPGCNNIMDHKNTVVVTNKKTGKTMVNCGKCHDAGIKRAGERVGHDKVQKELAGNYEVIDGRPTKKQDMPKKQPQIKGQTSFRFKPGLKVESVSAKDDPYNEFDGRDEFKPGQRPEPDNYERDCWMCKAAKHHNMKTHIKNLQNEAEEMKEEGYGTGPAGGAGIYFSGDDRSQFVSPEKDEKKSVREWYTG